MFHPGLAEVGFSDAQLGLGAFPTWCHDGHFARSHGNDDVGWIEYVTLPSVCVGASVGVEVRIGVERMKTSALIARLSPKRVFLIGIAGSFDTNALPVGSATFFDAVAIEGIGVGQGAALLGPPALGFPQWPGAGASSAILDRLELVPPGRPCTTSGSNAAPRLLLTTCAASATRAEALQRIRRFPEACAEDMEGFGVALACALERVPLSIVRGISNAVGDREPAHWRIPAALAAARELALAVLSE